MGRTSITPHSCYTETLSSRTDRQPSKVWFRKADNPRPISQPLRGKQQQRNGLGSGGLLRWAPISSGMPRQPTRPCHEAGHPPVTRHYGGNTSPPVLGIPETRRSTAPRGGAIPGGSGDPVGLPQHPQGRRNHGVDCHQALRAGAGGGHTRLGHLTPTHHAGCSRMTGGGLRRLAAHLSITGNWNSCSSLQQTEDHRPTDRAPSALHRLPSRIGTPLTPKGWPPSSPMKTEAQPLLVEIRGPLPVA